MIQTFNDLELKYSKYTDIKGKIRREVQAGNLVKIIKGLYETNPKANGKYLTSYIYGPSYISFEYVLSYYSLIPEAVYRTYTCATFNKRRSKKYKTPFGLYWYRDVPNAVFKYGVKTIFENGYSYQIASLEKALCDKLYSIFQVNTLKDLKYLLFEFLRIDEDMFWNLNLEDIKFIAPLYKASNLNLLVKLIYKQQKQAHNL